MTPKPLLAAALLAALAAPAFARNACTDTTVTAQNDSGREIKLVDVGYMIAGLGKTSPAIRTQDIPAGAAFRVTRDLQRAGGRATQVVIFYRLRTDAQTFGKWSGLKKARSAVLACTANRSFTLSLTN